MYCSPNDVRDKTIAKLTIQAGWSDDDLENRIEEADAVIDARLATQGYTVPFAATPMLIKRLSILWARGAVIRDLSAVFGRGGNQPSYSVYFDSFEKIVTALTDGTLSLIDADGVIISGSVGQSSNRVASNVGEVSRALTMAGAENDSLDEDYWGVGVI